MATPGDEENAPKERTKVGTVTPPGLSGACDGATMVTAKDSKPELVSRPASAITKDITAMVHQLASTASNEMLCGIGLGLVVCVYLILGRLGLVLIGVFGGILLHATWEGHIIPISELEDARKEKALDIMKRVLDWRERQAIDNSDEPKRVEEQMVAGRGFEGLPMETGAALSALVEAIIENYVTWWYNPIIPTDESFPATCRHTLTTFLRSLSIHMSRKRPADSFLDILTNSSSIFIVFINELSTAITTSLGTSASTADAVHIYLSSRPESSLASIVNRSQQRKKFRLIAEDILQCFLNKPVYECIQTRVFLKEMLANVLEMSLSACSKPEWINGWIVYLLEDGEPELNQAIDVGVGGVPSGDLDAGIENAKFTESKRTEERKHQKRLSKAEEAMEEAIREARRLSQLIAESDERKAQSLENPALGVEPSERLQNGTNDAQAAGRRSQTTNPESTSDNSTRFPTLTSMLDSAVKLEGAPRSSFTSFDQIVPPVQVTAVQPEPQRSRRQTASLTLCNANIIIHDDSTVNDRGRIGSKPTTDYLIQIEPESSEYPGWMIVRRYPDFEALHEVLWRIAKIAGVAAFTEQHSSLPSWKTHTRSSLRGELERYLRDACWHQPLAECEGMKHFLEKDQSNMQISSNKGLSWPTPATFENMGKGVLDALTSAPKGAAEGGKAVLGGVTGVFGGISSLGQKKRGSMSNTTFHTAGKFSISALPRLESTNSYNPSRSGTEDEGNIRLSPILHTQPAKVSPMERKPSNTSIAENGLENETRKGRTSTSSRSSLSGQNSTCASRDPSRPPFIRTSPSTPTQVIDVENIILPPPPSEIPDDYGSPVEESTLGRSRSESLATTTRTSTSTASSLGATLPATAPALTKRSHREAPPLTELETRVAIELLFACVSELYTLSSAWKFRRTLLTAAKTFLLRPGNPSLTSIQALIQDSVIASNVSDSGIAAHLRKLRENTIPTEEERNAWPPEMTGIEKERLRVKARKLLVERGLPSALTGVMGQVATGEAMGRVFDCLQVEEVARGLMFGLLLQGVRTLTH
jgi:PXA domain/Sorting nexin C terminal/PX domain